MPYVPVARTKFEKPFPLASIFSRIRGILNFTRTTEQTMSSAANRSIPNHLLHLSGAASLLESPFSGAMGSSTSFPAVTKVDGLPPAPSNIFWCSRYFEVYSSWRAGDDLR